MGRRRSSPSSTSDSATASAFHIRTSASVNGKFGRRAEQLRAKDVRVRRVDDHALDRLVQQRRRMVHQVGVQRIVAGDHHDQRALPAAARAAGLLPERRDGAGKARQHHRVQARDVDTELQRVGGGQAAQFAFGQALVPVRGGPRPDSPRGRTPPARPARERRPPAGPAHPAPSARRRGETGRTSASARPRRSGRPSPGPLRHRRNAVPERRFRRRGRSRRPAPTAPRCARRAASRPRSPPRRSARSARRRWRPGAAVVALAKITVGLDV